jgi:hypothetical protein
MEIKMANTTYCLNPRRIIYVQYFIAHVGYPYSSHDNTYSPYTSQSELEKIEKTELIQLSKFIRIKMTDNEEIMFCTTDDNYYNEIKEKMERIIGG